MIDAIAYARKEGKEPTALAKAYVSTALAEKRYHAIFVFEGVWTEEDYEAFRKQTGAQPARACACVHPRPSRARAPAPHGVALRHSPTGMRLHRPSQHEGRRGGYRAVDMQNARRV